MGWPQPSELLCILSPSHPHPHGAKRKRKPEGPTLLGDLSTLHFSVLESNWRENREEKEAGKGTFHSRPHVLEDPKFSRTACHVSKPKLTCFIRAPPPPRPRPGPPGPSPCSGCGACLQRQRILYTIQGAVPIIRLQGSKLLLLKPCYHIEIQHLLPQLSSITSPLRSQVHLEPPPPVLPHDPLALKGGGEAGREGGFGEVARQSPHQGLHLEGPDRTFGFWPSLSSAHRPIEQQEQLERPEQGAQGHDQTWLGYRGTRTGCARAGDQDTSAPGQTGMGGSQGASSSSPGLSPPPRGKKPAFRML